MFSSKQERSTALYPQYFFLKEVRIEFETDNPHTPGFSGQKCLLSAAFYCITAFKMEGQFASGYLLHLASLYIANNSTESF